MSCSSVFILVLSVALLLQDSQAFVTHSSGWASSYQSVSSAVESCSISAGSSTSLGVASMGPSSKSEEDTMTVSVTSKKMKKTTAANLEDGIDWDWKELANDVFTKDQRPIILFDGVCNLCNGAINFAMDQDETGKLRFCSLHSKVAKSLLLRQGKSPQDFSTIVMVTDKDAYYSSDAVSRICMELDSVPFQLFGQLGQITPDFVREAIYQVVSNNRYQFGEYDSCRLDFDGTLATRFVADPEEEEKSTSS